MFLNTKFSLRNSLALSFINKDTTRTYNFASVIPSSAFFATVILSIIQLFDYVGKIITSQLLKAFPIFSKNY